MKKTETITSQGYRSGVVVLRGAQLSPDAGLVARDIQRYILTVGFICRAVQYGMAIAAMHVRSLSVSFW